MKKLFAFLISVLLGAAASAAPTAIADLPLLNITGSGNVRPNLMLLYDNSGSMMYNFTPDYVNDYCRNNVTLSAGSTGCSHGHPPFDSPDFNRQYYNPAVRYTPPVDALGNAYTSMTSQNTAGWTQVPNDGFNVNTYNIINTPEAKSNLASAYPDMLWCDSAGNCVAGTGTPTYTYPNNTYKVASPAKYYATAPFYYTINVAEYCKESTLKTCTSVAVGAAAPAGYPYPAKVRFCTAKDLKTCQAKYGRGYIYPRFSVPGSTATAAYGLVTIGASATTGDLVMDSISVAESGGTVVITNGAVTATGGTTTLSKQAALANQLAAAIVAKTGLTRQYLACVRTPTVAGVPDCADYGINLPTNNMLAIVPIACPAGVAKTDDSCTVVGDGSRNGWAISASAQSKKVGNVNDAIPTAVTALGSGAPIFVRTDIVASNNSYPKGDARSDCAGANCTYDEEMTNFANWYAYYKTRNQMMKTAVGQAFQPINGNYNVGIVSLSSAAASPESASGFTFPAQFTGADRTAWYKALYGMNGSDSTPLRLALNAVGRMYANVGKFVRAAGSEVIQYPCQQNFAFVTTDGYWNGGPATGVASNDNAEDFSRFCSSSLGCVDTRTQTVASLADIALHWYNGGSSTDTVSLRSDIDDIGKDGLVPGGSSENRHLHMNTYALGLGVDGVMTFDPKYDTGATVGSDFYNLVTGVTSGCPWNNNQEYVWPDPNTGLNSPSAALQERVDDLWHAAINGHGKYFSASDPTEVVDGLSKALSNIEAHVGAAAASATSTPNITLEDNDIFSATFTTVKWFGVLTDRKLDPVSGEVVKSILWNSSNTVGAKVDAAADTRKLLMLDVDKGGLKDFLYSKMNNVEKAWFDNKCGALAQCADLTAADRLIVNSGANIVNWLRGQQQYADDTRLRAYASSNTADEGVTKVLPIVLGDIASSKPAYQRDPRKNYPLADYSQFKVDNAARKPAVFVAANDGMLHAFDAANGDELWAYLPRITMKKLHLQASTTYRTNHQFSTDGSPEIADVKIDDKWRSVLVAGLNAGGRGYYALDVTDPLNPVALWELCADASVCSGASFDADLGLSFGNPQFGTWKDAGGTERWVVFLTSGYNNIPATGFSGSGKGYLYVVDVKTGQVLSKTSTNVGDATTPSGLAKITAITSNPAVDPLVTYVYGGDNQGRMWRFDFTAAGNPKVLQMGDAGTRQPVTTRPEVTQCQIEATDAAGVKTLSAQRVVVFGTGRLLDLPDISDTAVQSVYVLKDSGAAIPAASWRNESAMTRQSLSRVAKTQAYSITSTAANLGAKAAWYFDLDQNAGERVNLDPKVASNTLTVVANLPSSSSSCKVGGSSNVYQMNVCTAAPVNTLPNGTAIAGDTLSGNSAAVGFIIVRLPSGALKMVTTTADGNTITSSVARATAVEAHRAGWRRVRE